MTSKLVLIAGSLLFPFCMSGQDPSPVCFVNTGKMAVALNKSNTSIYVPFSIRMTGRGVNLLQDGRTDLDGYFYNDVEENNIFDNQSTGSYRFKGSMRQRIEGTADRSRCYIAFPNVEIRNPQSVELDSQMGMDVGELNLTQGKIVLKSTAIDDVSSHVAHMRVKSGVNYNPTASNIADKGVVEVELNLETAGGRDGRFFGFSSPYKQMYSDYFFFCYLTQPNYLGLFGNVDKKTIVDPTHSLKSGEAYLVGQNVFGEEGIRKDPVYEPYDESGRMGEMLVLNRWVMNPKINAVPDLLGSATAYNEEINTDDVLVNLDAGYNYIGNPFTCPLDVTSLLDDETTGNDPWQITRGSAGNLRARFWILNGGTASQVINQKKEEFKIMTNWMVAQKVGDTYTLEGVNSEPVLIEPMQIIRLQAKASSITIPASKQSHGKGVFLRSSGSYSRTDDELLLQVVDADTRAFDRICIVFREGASTESGDEFDSEKVFNYSGGASQLYTPSSNGKDMTVNVVPRTTTSLAVYLSPCREEKRVNLTAHRLSSLHSPQGVWLEDLQKGEMVDLLNNSSYSFTTRPDDSPNRFILHFTPKGQTGLTSIDTSPLWVSYRNGLLYVNGITAEDNGAKLSVCNVQGRIVLSDIIKTQGNRYQTELSVPPGVYIVKITGKRNHTSKILSK